MDKRLSPCRVQLVGTKKSVQNRGIKGGEYFLEGVIEEIGSTHIRLFNHHLGMSTNYPHPRELEDLEIGEIDSIVLTHPYVDEKLSEHGVRSHQMPSYFQHFDRRIEKLLEELQDFKIGPSEFEAHANRIIFREIRSWVDYGGISAKGYEAHGFGAAFAAFTDNFSALSSLLPSLKEDSSMQKSPNNPAIQEAPKNPAIQKLLKKLRLPPLPLQVIKDESDVRQLLDRYCLIGFGEKAYVQRSDGTYTLVSESVITKRGSVKVYFLGCMEKTISKEYVGIVSAPKEIPELKESLSEEEAFQFFSALSHSE